MNKSAEKRAQTFINKTWCYICFYNVEYINEIALSIDKRRFWSIMCQANDIRDMDDYKKVKNLKNTIKLQLKI